MAKKERPHPQVKEKSPKLFMTRVLYLPLTLFAHLLKGIFLALGIAIVIEWLGLYYFWPDEPHHAQAMFEYEFNTLGTQFKSTIGNFSPVRMMTTAVTYTYAFLFDSWLITYISHWVAMESKNSFSNLIRFGLIDAKTYITGAGFVVVTLIMRVVIFTLALPWFFLCALTGTVNGLVEREIRKAEGGMEHAFMHHNTRNHLPWIVQGTWIIYLSLPFAIHPSLILIPGGILFGLLIYVTSWTFKKYL